MHICMVMAGDEEGDRRRHARMLRQCGNRFPLGFLGGGGEKRHEKFGELPEVRFRRMGNSLEIRHGGHQHHIFLPHGSWPLKFSKPVGQRTTQQTQTQYRLKLEQMR